jgi:hypothetical protein
MTITKPQRTALRRLATESIANGRGDNWQHDGGSYVAWGDEFIAQAGTVCDAAFIAAANPAVVLALLDALDEAEIAAGRRHPAFVNAPVEPWTEEMKRAAEIGRQLGERYGWVSHEEVTGAAEYVHPLLQHAEREKWSEERLARCRAAIEESDRDGWLTEESFVDLLRARGIEGEALKRVTRLDPSPAEQARLDAKLAEIRSTPRLTTERLEALIATPPDGDDHD